jgi:hypothetical protein
MFGAEWRLLQVLSSHDPSAYGGARGVIISGSAGKTMGAAPLRKTDLTFALNADQLL